MTVLHFSFADSKIDFASFLEVMYVHSQKEKCQQEILQGFQAQDSRGTGTVPGNELMQTLTKFGEKLDRQEGNSQLVYLEVCFFVKKCYMS